MDKNIPKLGDIYMCELTGYGHEQRGTRPVLIFQNNVGNQHSPTVAVLPITSRIKKTEMPTHVFIRQNTSGLTRDSVIQAESPYCVDKRRLGQKVGKLSEKDLARVAAASILASSAITYLDESRIQWLFTTAERLVNQP